MSKTTKNVLDYYQPNIIIQKPSYDQTMDESEICSLNYNLKDKPNLMPCCLLMKMF